VQGIERVQQASQELLAQQRRMADVVLQPQGDAAPPVTPAEPDTKPQPEPMDLDVVPAADEPGKQATGDQEKPAEPLRFGTQPRPKPDGAVGRKK